MELCWGDVGLLLAMPRQGLGNAAIAAVANEEQLQRFGGTWAAMAITEPGCGSDSAAIRTTATQDGDHYVLNGEKIFVTSGERADAVVVWATLNRNLGRAAIKSFVVEKGTPGMTVTRLEKKLGIKASDTASISFNDCRVPAANLLGNAEVDVQKGFAGVMETFDNTRPLVAGMAVGVAKAALDRTRELLKKAGCKFDYRKPLLSVSHAEATLYRLEAEWEAARLLTLKAAWMADNKLPNSKEASIAKAKAGRVANEITLKCVELAGALGYAEDELLEKWARDSKILDIFEGTPADPTAHRRPPPARQVFQPVEVERAAKPARLRRWRGRVHRRPGRRCWMATVPASRGNGCVPHAPASRPVRQSSRPTTGRGWPQGVTGPCAG